MLLHGTPHGTARLMGVRAVTEAAVFRKLEYLPEIPAYLFRLHVERAEALYAGRVDCPAAIRQRQHLAERCRVHARVVGFAYPGRAQVKTGYETVEQRTLPHSTVTAEQRYPVLEQRSEIAFHRCRNCRDSPTFIAYRLVKMYHHPLVFKFFCRQDVGLVENKHHRNAVSLGRSKKAVNERGGCLRIIHRHHEKGLVDVGCYDVALLRLIGLLAYDMITAILYVGDKRRFLGIAHDDHSVADGHGVCAAYSLETEIALYLTLYRLTLVGLHRVPAACVLNNQSGHINS